MAPARWCIYCATDKPISDFSDEHIIPRFLGGSSSIPEIVTNCVCQRCNSAFGRHVDAAVAKGYFLNSVERGSWRGCFDFNEKCGNIYPLIYFGKSSEITFGINEEVEVWLSPDGGTAWHIHTKSDEDFDAFAGGDPMLRRNDATGRVYAFIASNQAYWAVSNFKSVQQHFYREPIFLGTDSNLEVAFAEQRQPGVFCQKTELELSERDRIRRILDQRRPLNHLLQMDLLFDVRFLAKLAIAFGHKLFGVDFASLKYTEFLRKLLWTRRKDLQVNNIEVYMKSYFAGLQDFLLKSINFQFGFVFLLKLIHRSLVLCIIFPSGHSTQVTIVDEKTDSHFNLLNRWKGDHVFLSIPQLRRTIGPIMFAEYLSWKLGNIRVPSLDDLSARITFREQMPPLRNGN